MTDGASEPGNGAGSDTDARLRQQELVAASGLFALQYGGMDGVFDQVCAGVTKGLRIGFSKVLEYRSESHDFLLRNGVGWRAGVVGQTTLGADLASPAGFALRTRMPVVSNYLEADGRFHTPRVLAEHGIQRAINVVIDTGDAVPYGVLEADSTDGSEFSTHDVAFLQSLANVLAAVVVRQRQQDAQAALLQEKDMLMREVHHRVRNNLQLVQTMLHLQARGASDAGERQRLQDAGARVMSIAAVHGQLHEAGVGTVNLQDYLGRLLAELASSLGITGQRAIQLDAVPVGLSVASATPVGLIVVELVTNAVKYGAGDIVVRCRETPCGMDVVVEDNGPGFPAGYKVGQGRSLGMRLVTALARSTDAVTLSYDGAISRVSVAVTFARENAA